MNRKKKIPVWVLSTSTPLYSHRGMDRWMDERMNGRVAFEYLLLTDRRRQTWQEETGGSWGAVAGSGRERKGARGELWMDGLS